MRTGSDGSRPPGGARGPGNGRQSAVGGLRDRHRGQVEQPARADAGAAGHVAGAGVRLGAGEAEAGPTRTSSYPAEQPAPRRRPAPPAGRGMTRLTCARQTGATRAARGNRGACAHDTARPAGGKHGPWAGSRPTGSVARRPASDGSTATASLPPAVSGERTGRRAPIVVIRPGSGNLDR